MSLNNKVVLITGSGSGIGAAAALLFAKEGCNIVIVDKNEDGAKSVGKKCEEFGKKVLIIAADITRDEETEMIMKKTIDTFGKLDVLVNNAGIVKGSNIMSGILMETFDEVMNTNLRGAVALTSLSAPHLVDSKGCIVNISSVAAFSAKIGGICAAYSVSKAAMVAFTNVSALELSVYGVRVNAIAPGPVNTNISVNTIDQSKIEEYMNAIALKKIAEPEEIANMIVYLASDKAKSITGSCFVIDNGMLLK